MEMLQYIKDKIHSETGYVVDECIVVPFALKVNTETIDEFKTLLEGIANVEVLDKGKKQFLLITPKHS